MTTNVNAYRLFWDMSHLKSNELDAILVPFPGSEQIGGWKRTDHVEVASPILFEAKSEAMRHSDFPSNDENWPLMSPRMLETLCRVGKFSHRRIPVRLVDREVLAKSRSLPDRKIRAEFVDDSFVAVQLTNHLDVVDWNKSVFERTTIGTVEIFGFDRLVLQDPPDGLPPIFRIAADKSKLLVSTQARVALEEAGIRGIAFEPLPGMGPPPQRD
ncbi:hypothetical protein [Haliangium ochraceum]|uniref:Uncharacterized protein n=1 Tax=Haliangium ochraceum (strain DSM 14365 / JCM 11303 / SMP-2) TaxID=502025 RepID=D0LTT4_HALO1|nr:hypothetical protein [Haliangium ochraceum]ACY15778.1 hypothetical protein Hoch_3276 [Haliangium ochraceum DSM 14365]